MRGPNLSSWAALALASSLLLGCESAPALGAACSRASECSAPLVCQFGRCRTSCVENRDCPIGATCLPSGAASACSVDVDLGCETGVGRMCPAGLTCVADRCVATCVAANDCPSDGECRESPLAGISFCYDARLPVSDAGPRDTGVLDGGAEDASGQADGGADAGAAGGCHAVCVQGGYDRGADHERACAICDGRVLCWGYDGDEGLGDGMGPTLSGLPVAVLDTSGTPLIGFHSLACGEHHACAVNVGGEVFCWGSDEAGRRTLGHRGDGSRADRAVGVPAGTRTVAAGENHTCAASDDELLCWGENNQGQCDPTPMGYVPAAELSPPMQHPEGPVMPFDVGAFARVGASRSRTCAVRPGAPSSLSCVGLSEFGSGGVRDLTALVTATGSVAVDFGAGEILELALGRGHTCALMSDDRVYCFGFQVHGSLGVDPEVAPLEACADGPCTTTPHEVVLSATIEHVGSGASSDHACASDEGGGLYCWGWNARGQCGVAPLEADESRLPTRVEGLEVRVDRIATGLHSTCVTTESGELYCWGANDDGQLGRGTGSPAGTPTPTRVVISAP